MAETSVTIADIKFVVDCGLHKTKAADPTTGVEALILSPVSKQQANQVSRCLSLSSGFRGLYLYVVDYLLHVEWYIRQLWCYFTILYNITIIAYKNPAY